VGFAGGVWGGAYGVELPVWPGRAPSRIKDTGAGSLDGLQPGDARWLLVAVDGQAIAHKGQALAASLGEGIALASGPARVLVHKHDDGSLQIVRFEPLTSLARARAFWVLSIVARFVVLAAVGWFLSR
jgi:hypothetical protein